jgi:hypothetical protein
MGDINADAVATAAREDEKLKLVLHPIGLDKSQEFVSEKERNPTRTQGFTDDPPLLIVKSLMFMPYVENAFHGCMLQRKKERGKR